jgi:WD40 repeat protein
VAQGRNGMVSTNCCAVTPLGKTLWKTGERLLTATSVQALLCIAFCGPTSFVTGAEDGSLLLWENEELVNVFPLHRGLLIDISIDCRDMRRTAGHPFYLVTAGNDGTVRLSRCIRHELHQERCILMPSAAVSVCNFFGAHKSAGLEFMGNRGNKFDRDECPKPLSTPSNMEVKPNLDNVPHAKKVYEDSLAQIFVVGTVDNSVYTIDFCSENGIQEIVCGHRQGRIICLSREANSGYEFYTVAEDGLVRLWDADQFRALSSWRAMDAYEHEGIANHTDFVSCAELSHDGKYLIIGFASGQMLIFNAHKKEFQRLISKELEVEVQMLHIPGSYRLLPKEVVFSLLQKKPSSVEDRIRLDRLEKLHRVRHNIEKSLMGISHQFCQEDLEKVKGDIDSLESKIKTKAEAGIQGLNLIPAELSLIQGLRMKIEIFQSAHRDQSLDQNDFSRFSECNACLTRLLHDPYTICEVTYEISTGLYHIKLERELQNLCHGQKLTLQKRSFRIPSSVGKLSILRISPDNIFVAVCGERGAEIRFLARLHERVCKIKGMEGTVTHMDWARDSRHFQTNSDGNHLCFWELQKSCGTWECMLVQPKDAADMKWATFSCSMGWMAQSRLSNTTDRRNLIVKANAKQDLVAMGNDQGAVFLNHYSQGEDENDRIVHQCHAAAISALIFLALGNVLVSTSTGENSIAKSIRRTHAVL